MSKQVDKFNKTNTTEKARVQCPAMIHLLRLGYDYYGKIASEKRGKTFDSQTNILLDVFEKQFKKLNPNFDGDIETVLREIRHELNEEDLGKSFYKRLCSSSPTKLIDFNNVENNTFHFSGEVACLNDDEEFRPDITLFVNGLPLVFIEVKIPNNKQGTVAEMDRMNEERFPNTKFRRFINITQLMIFSNNQEYDTEGGIKPIQGAFYCTGARKSTKFNCFREENPANKPVAPFIDHFPYLDINEETQKRLLSDFNCISILGTKEFITNSEYTTPTNRIITSMCSKERLLYILKYGIAYVNSEKEIDGKLESVDEKHIMRYQQLFASMAVEKALEKNVKSGVIWHTQGSGKTALSYYLTKVLTDYYAKKNTITKFYFVVDRLQLLEQAKDEFSARGLEVKTPNNRKELMAQFMGNHSQEGLSGKPEITVVNIQRFSEKEKIELNDYATNLQRIFIIDEAHRGYAPTGSFLANLIEADPKSVKIALTGTPLLQEERSSWKIFGNYLHTYYYDKSIQDGYTLRIIREDIATEAKDNLSNIYDTLEQYIEKKDLKKSYITEHDNYVKELLRYIIKDFKEFRTMNDDSLGGMVVCETSEQARKIYSYFDKIQDELGINGKKLKPGLILHGEGTKEERRKIVDDFKRHHKIDILIVFNMLLTGFDAPRMKRLYLGRELHDHNLLQALTRVNRPYKDYKYGYVVDFADIKKAFYETNAEYLKELNRFNDVDELGDPSIIDTLKSVLMSPEDIDKELKEVNQELFDYNTQNLEEFSKQISEIENKETLLSLKKSLQIVKDLYNVIRLLDNDDLNNKVKNIDFSRYSAMLSEVGRRIDLINQKELFSVEDTTKQIINSAMEEISFTFELVDQEELNIVSGEDNLRKKWIKMVRDFDTSDDKEDPKYITLKEAFFERFKEWGFKIESVEEYNERVNFIHELSDELKKLYQLNSNLKSKYNDDEKFLRVHKRIKENHIINTEYESDIVNFLKQVKKEIDLAIYNKEDILTKESYFARIVMNYIANISAQSSSKEIRDSLEDKEPRVFIQQAICKQYLNQYEPQLVYA